MASVRRSYHAKAKVFLLNVRYAYQARVAAPMHYLRVALSSRLSNIASGLKNGYRHILIFALNHQPSDGFGENILSWADVPALSRLIAIIGFIDDHGVGRFWNELGDCDFRSGQIRGFWDSSFLIWPLLCLAKLSNFILSLTHDMGLPSIFKKPANLVRFAWLISFALLQLATAYLLGLLYCFALAFRSFVFIPSFLWVVPFIQRTLFSGILSGVSQKGAPVLLNFTPEFSRAWIMPVLVDGEGKVSFFTGSESRCKMLCSEKLQHEEESIETASPDKVPSLELLVSIPQKRGGGLCLLDKRSKKNLQWLECALKVTHSVRGEKDICFYEPKEVEKYCRYFKPLSLASNSMLLYLEGAQPWCNNFPEILVSLIAAYYPQYEQSAPIWFLDKENRDRLLQNEQKITDSGLAEGAPDGTLSLR